MPGQHPWHAALYHNKNVELTYICGANLISKNFVLTVAHCATRQATGTALNPRLLVVVLGKYYLERLASTGIQERNVRGFLNSSIARLSNTSNINTHIPFDPKTLYQKKKNFLFLDFTRAMFKVRTVLVWKFWSNFANCSGLKVNTTKVIFTITNILPPFFDDYYRNG